MPIRYEQTRDDSIALLKLVIARMNQHAAPCHPHSYAVWYEHLAGLNPALSKALEAALAAQPSLPDETVAALWRDHVAAPDEAATESLQQEFGRVMAEVARSAASTGEQAGAYGQQLAGLSQALQALPEGGVGERLGAVAQGTARMQASVETLQRTVAEGEREIERLRQALERTRTEALTDALSQLLNRKGFDRALAELMARRPGGGLVHALMLFDIDHFKRINDSHGHVVGDTVIEGVGRILRSVAEGTRLQAARYGGEEFALLMPAATLAEAVRTAEGVLAKVRQLKVRKRGTQEVLASTTISCGIAPWVPGDDAASWVAAADAALYRAKQAGRDRVTVA